jgi:hypothetical protein
MTNEARDRAVFSPAELRVIGNIAFTHRAALVESIQDRFGKDNDYQAIALALAMLFASSMTDDADQQADQARSTNAVMASWGTRTPWRLVPVEDA